MAPTMRKIILATESKYKKSLFSRLNLAFESVAADIDETPKSGESAKALAARLAKEKALAISGLKEGVQYWIIGADQAASCGNNLIGKPKTHERAVADLKIYADNTVVFYTSACVLSPDNRFFHVSDKTTVNFRDLSNEEIENYLRIEQPYDCAGAFKAEGLGISLFDSIESFDPTALIGLPLIQLADLLRKQGFDCYGMPSA